MRIPASMDTDDYARLGCDAHAKFLEMLNQTQKQALVCTIALRTAELTQLEEEYDALSQPCSIVDRLVSERLPDVSVETEPAYTRMPTLRATARYWLGANMPVIRSFLQAKVFSLDSELVIKEAAS
jgi:hypothetical protein